MFTAYVLVSLLAVAANVSVPPVGVAAATGLVVFYVAAVVSHLRVRDYADLAFLALAFLALAVAALALRLAV